MPVHIVPPDRVLSMENIMLEKNSIRILSRLASSKKPKRTLRWAAKRSLISNSLLCDRCDVLCTLQKDSRCRDGFKWKCKYCGKCFSVRKGTCFSKSLLFVWQIVILMHGWSEDIPQRVIKKEAGVNKNSVVKWYKFFRSICTDELRRKKVELGGLNEDGTQKIVELDESFFFRRKYHRGAWRPGRWVFGGIERGTKMGFAIEVPDRKAVTLSLAIAEHVLPGTRIITDGWTPYRAIEHIRPGGIYTHDVVVHQNFFVNPRDPEVHTNFIENMWARLKRPFKRRYGTSRAFFTSYLQEFTWRQMHNRGEMFSNLIHSISQKYTFGD